MRTHGPFVLFLSFSAHGGVSLNAARRPATSTASAAAVILQPFPAARVYWADGKHIRVNIGPLYRHVSGASMWAVRVAGDSTARGSCGSGMSCAGSGRAGRAGRRIARPVPRGHLLQDVDLGAGHRVTLSLVRARRAPPPGT